MTKAMLLRTCAALAVPFAAVAGFSNVAAAQQITTTIEGQVNNASGQPLANAQVTVTDTRTGATTQLTTDATGRFSAQNLTTGGPYTVTAVASGFQGQTVNDVNTSLQGATTLAFSLDAAAAEGTAETIVVTGTRARVSQVSNGPGTSFGADVLANSPSFNRDIRDVIRIDPRVSLNRDDQTGQDRISCLGGNDRGNTFTVDGTLQGDVYGLNETGFSARSSTPLPFDAIRETQIQFAPFDVEVGQFTGCSINVVTRSGTNKIRATGYYEYTSDKFTGDTLDGVKQSIVPFKDKRWGVSAGGPIIKDRLFIYGAYEQSKSADTQDAGPIGAGYNTQINGVSLAQFTEIRQVLKDVYGVDTGDLATALPFSNKRWFLRSDLNLGNHRLEATYQHLDESKTGSDDFFTGDTPQVTGYNTYFISGSKSDFYSGRFYSQWTDKISSELRYSHVNIIDKQDPIGGYEAQSDNPLPRFIIGNTNVINGTTYLGTVLAGPGANRAANDLRVKVDQYKAAVKVSLGNHTVKAGAELNSVDLFNLFVNNATGTLVFRNVNDLRNGILSPGTGNNQTSTFPNNVTSGATEAAFGSFAPGNDVNTAAAQFKRKIWSFYVQDDVKIGDNLDVTLGFRSDFFSGDRPTLNQNFVNRYGIRNDTGFNDIPAVLMPRLSATYRLPTFAIFDRSRVRAGLGVFSGGDPLVWFGNAFQNDGATFATVNSQQAGCTAAQLQIRNGTTFTGFPQCVITFAGNQAAAGQGFVQSIDPDIENTDVLRWNLGFDTTLRVGTPFLDGWRITADYIGSRYRNPFTIVDLAQAVDPSQGLGGYTIDGRPIYRQIDLARAGCTGRLIDPGSPPIYTGINSACFFAGNGARVQEYMLTNADSYTSHLASIIVSRDWNRGLLTSGGRVGINFGYAYTNAKDRRNLGNSTANSNYGTTVAFDRQNPEATRGFYSNTHQITFSANFAEQFFKDLDTRLGFTFVARSGRPYSLTWTGNSVFGPSQAGSDNAPLYIPTGINDPNLSPLSNATAVQNLVNFVDTLECARKYKGRTIARNSCSNDWFYDMDVRFSQELPGVGRLFGRDDSIEVYAMIDNFLNLLDDKWNIFRRREASGRVNVAQLGTVSGFNGVDAQGRYIVTGYTGNTFDARNEIKRTSSLWRLKFGVSYKF